MLPYFPLENDEYAITMNARALPVDRLIEVEVGRYREELAEKERILAGDHRYYFRGAEDTIELQWEAVEVLLPNMARHDPDSFALERQGARWRWTNRQLATETLFTLGDGATLPLAPLDWLGRQVQEDLLLLAGDQEGTPLVAGQLCFAAGWSLDEKIERSFLTIHDPVPGFAGRIGRSADLLMQRLKAGHPAGRVGWSVVTSEQLNRAPIVAPNRGREVVGVTASNAGERCFLRLERQTFSRLPRTWGVLFTIHTYLASIAMVAADPVRARRLAANLRTMPEALQEYKGLPPYREALLAFLDRVTTYPHALE